MSSTRDYKSWIVLLLLTASIAWAVLHRGGRILADWNICLLGVALASLVYLWRKPPVAIEPFVGRLILLLPGYVALQLLPLPASVISLVSPQRYQLLLSLAPLNISSSFAPLTVSSSTTLLNLLRVISGVLLFLVVRNITRRARERQSYATALPLILIAFPEACYGILQYFNGQEPLGTYGNWTHLAFLIEMALPLSVACVMGYFQAKPDWSSPTRRALLASVMAVAAATLLVALAVSGAKAGFIGGMAGLFVMGAIAVGTRLRGGSRMIAVAGVAVLVLLLLIFLPSAKVIGSMGDAFTGSSGSTLEGRLPVWRDTLRMIRDFPVFGVGLGNFGTTFLKYQSSGTDLSFNSTHNDYLQIASELGLGALIPACLMGSIVVFSVRAALRGRDPCTRYLGLGCVGAFTGVAIHSLSDFNLYIRANAMMLAWLSGIAAALPIEVGPAAQRRRFPTAAFLRRAAIVFAVILIVYTPVWIVFEKRYHDDPSVERKLCRFGICDTDAVQNALMRAHNDISADVPLPDLMEAVRREPTQGVYWCELAEGVWKAGRQDQARYCVSTALSRGPKSPPVVWLAMLFYDETGDRQRALSLSALLANISGSYDSDVFDVWKKNDFSHRAILDALQPLGERGLRIAMYRFAENGDTAGALSGWAEMVRGGYGTEALAGELARVLFYKKEYDAAAQAWAIFMGDRAKGYRVTNLVLNGDFENAPAASPLDWTLSKIKGAETELDPSVAHSGTQSLRIHFTGTENVEYVNAQIAVPVSPGNYRFEAYIRTQGITTAKGVAIRIADSENWSRLNVRSDELTGTNDWRKIEIPVRVSKETRLLTIRVERARETMRFETQIAGTVWVDGVSLVRARE